MADGFEGEVTDRHAAIGKILRHAAGRDEGLEGRAIDGEALMTFQRLERDRLIEELERRQPPVD